MANRITAVALLMVCTITVIKADGYCLPPWADTLNKPNIIIFNADDMGWGDLSSYGHPTQEWGPVDAMSTEGMRFTNFYSPSSVCSPSRAGLLTGRIPERVGVRGGIRRVFYADNVNGLPKEEITIAEGLKDAGYTTGFIGKWHLGVNAHNHTDGTHLPYNHGFDYVGHMLSMGNWWYCEEEQWHAGRPTDPVPYPSDTYPDQHMCMLNVNDTIIQQPFSHYNLTESLVKDALSFMRSANQDGTPFFLYYGIIQPHVNLYSNDGFRGKSKRGRYGDNIMEMAWSVGAILEEVKRLREEFNTLAIFTSDHGPLLGICNEGGDAGILKGEKLHFWEGGIRVPAIFHWPGHIKPATSTDAVASHLDIFPTLMNIAGGSIPDDRIIDGQDISSVLFNWYPEQQPEPVSTKQLYNKPKQRKGQHESSPRLLVWFCQSTLMAVRFGCYKFHYVTQRTRSKEQYHAETGQCGEGGFPFAQYLGCGACGNKECNTHYDPPLMYNLCEDPNEAYPLNVTRPANEAALEAMKPALEEFLDNFEFGPRLLDGYSDDVIPCCTPETFPNCTCNYKYEGPTPPPRSLFHESYSP